MLNVYKFVHFIPSFVPGIERDIFVVIFLHLLAIFPPVRQNIAVKERDTELRRLKRDPDPTPY